MGEIAANKRSLAAIMFTDMVGYTALMQQDEQLARQKRERHRTVMTQLHEQHDGQIIQYFGDGTLSVFSSSVNAVQCAIEIQQQLKEPIEVPLRIGIHSGDIVIEEDNVLGDAVNLASRIESFSIPGAVLISETIYEQIKNQPQFSMVALGNYELKNVHKPVQIYALSAVHLTIPAPEELKGKGKRQSTKQSNLPLRLTSFLGRQKETEALIRMVQNSRLVTITGPGGTGKTSQALKVAERLEGHFQDGLTWVPLAAISDPQGVKLVIIKLLELIQTPSKSATELLIEFIGQKKMLLVLDNFEQVLPAATIIQNLVEACPNLHFLVTSRTILSLRAEQEFPLRPLQVPTMHHQNSFVQLMDYPSVQLFDQRAKAAKPNFVLDDHNVTEVATICQRLDGLPLGIELAAARIKIFPPKALLNRLDNHLDLLKSKNADRPVRHQTLRQTISWSYELLSEEERLLFMRLSVFSGGCNLPAVEKICADEQIQEFEIVDYLLALVDKSLVNQEEDPNGEPRFYMLETIRTFAIEQLIANNAYESFKLDHATYFMQKAEEASPHLIGPKQKQWCDELEADLDNFREALFWAIAKEHYEIALRIGIGLWRLWTTRGMLNEAGNYAERLLNLKIVEKLNGLHAQIRSALISIYFHTADFSKAVSHSKENLNYWVKVGDQEEIATNLNHLGFAYFNLGDLANGEKYTGEALTLSEKLGNLRGQAVSYNNYGWGYINAGQPKIAAANLEKSLIFRKKLGDLRGIGFALVNVARAQIYLGQFEEAEKNLKEGLEILEKNENRVIYFWGIIQLGILYARNNEFQKSTQLLRDHEGSFTNMAVSKGSQGNLLILRSHSENYDQADQLIADAIQLFAKGGKSFFLAIGWYERSKLAFANHDLEKAWSFLAQSFAINRKHNILLGIAENLELGGMLFATSNQYEKAIQLMAKAGSIRTQLEAPTPPVLITTINQVWGKLKEITNAKEFASSIQNGQQLTIEACADLLEQE